MSLNNKIITGHLSDGIAAIFAIGISKGIAIVSWTIFLSLAGSNLSLSNYGLLLLLANFASLAVLIGTFGQPQVLLFRSGKLGMPHRTLTHHRNLMGSVKVMGLMTFLSIMFFAILIYYKLTLDAWFIVAWSLWVAGSAWQALMAEEARSVSHMWTAGFASNSAAAGGSAVLMAALFIIFLMIKINFYQSSLHTYIFSLAAASVIFSTWLLVMYLKNCGRILISFKCQSDDAMIEPSQTWRSGITVTGIALSTFVIGQSDLWWATKSYGVDAAGSYGTASYLARFCSLLGILLASAYAARLSAMLANGKIYEVAKIVRKLSLLATAAGCMVWTFFLVSSEMGIFQRFFQFSAQDSSLALLILGAGHVLSCLFGFGPVLLAVAGRFKDLLVITCGSSIITTVLASIAVHLGGLSSLATAFCLGYLTFIFWCHNKSSSILGVYPFDSKLKKFKAML